MQEEKVFNELVLSPTSRALVHVFFAQRSTTKVIFGCNWFHELIL
jgi:enoyl-CoA hydratase/3-hydroxyacyl-CoA dehydrogenase